MVKLESITEQLKKGKLGYKADLKQAVLEAAVAFRKFEIDHEDEMLNGIEQDWISEYQKLYRQFETYLDELIELK
jgi:hypothetical protein